MHIAFREPVESSERGRRRSTIARGGAAALTAVARRVLA